MRSYLILILLFFLPASMLAEQTSPSKGEEIFVRRIAPLLREKCLGCHGNDEEEIEGGLDLRSAKALAGGDSGESLTNADELEHSPILLSVSRENEDWSAMPPKEAERLTEEQIGFLREWIEAGSPWPNTARQAEIEKTRSDAWSVEDGIQVNTSGGLDDAWTNRRYKPETLWAYQKVVRPKVPSSANAIDWLLLKAMPENLQPAPRADRVTLIRRATFDLTGLPPTPREVSSFVEDKRNDKIAFAAVIDRLLASKQYGERMAQHWLDVSRYADSSGLANDFERGNAWRYRDYVIRSFNEDKPYDQFVREQIAGDEIDPSDPEMLVAVGFLRMGPWELTGMEVAKVARQRFLDDVTNSVGEVFLAHSLQCARCHDHKFDPVPTRDYYSMQAVFATTQLAERKADFLQVENTDGFDEVKNLEKVRAAHEGQIREIDAISVKRAQEWFDKRGLGDKWKRALEEVGDQAQVFLAARKKMGSWGVANKDLPSKKFGFTPAEYGAERVARRGLIRLNWEFDRYKPFALSVYNGRTPDKQTITSPSRVPGNRLDKGELEQTAILTGGDPFSPAAKVSPGVLSALKPVLDCPDITNELEGRRLALANWIADAKNCLTTRVIVNRIWMWHFNQPIAGNPNNFGATGKPPTHPDLLDWLAARLVENGWSTKSLHQDIMNSDAYCRSSEHPDFEALTKADPTGTSYVRFRSRRLSAEEMRDARLAITGELNRRIGGIPCRPEINFEVAMQPRQIMGTFANAWIPNAKPEDRHRRTIYTHKLRGLPDPSLEVFNTPPRDFSCEQRDTPTITPQVFSLINGKSTHTRALVLAKRVLNATKSDNQAIEQLFKLAYSRMPTSEESTVCIKHWQEIKQELRKAPKPKKWIPPSEVVRRAVEENTGEPFSFSERLFGYDDFVPDLQPADADLRTRALADVCLVILNSNEFIYVY